MPSHQLRLRLLVAVEVNRSARFLGNRNRFNDIGVVLKYYFTQCPNLTTHLNLCGGDFWDSDFANLFTYGWEIFQLHNKKLCHVASVGATRCQENGRDTMELFYFQLCNTEVFVGRSLVCSPTIFYHSLTFPIASWYFPSN
jgi:hypothetical protein